jgi:hypothetical protein
MASFARIARGIADHPDGPLDAPASGVVEVIIVPGASPPPER